MAKRKSIPRSISLCKEVDDKVIDLADKLFQGNISMTIGYIISLYFEKNPYSQNENKAKIVKKGKDLSFLDD